MSGVEEKEGFDGAEDLPEDLRRNLGDLLLVLADNKRLLGMRYSDWILGAPALEAGIACSAMAQDEWGHGRILYAMLRDFGHDPDELEHGREASDYCNMEPLDRPVETWPELLALNILLDTALSVQFDAMAESRFEPIHYKVKKLLDEERFHFEHGRGWTLRLASTDEGREALEAAFDPVWDACLRWFGDEHDPVSARLSEAGITDAGPVELRRGWLDRVGPVVEQAGLGLARQEDGSWASSRAPTWNGWSPRHRRPEEAGGPDADTLRRVRGDKNRPLLMD